MSKELFEKRKYEFIETIIREKRLPKVWEFNFSDGSDQRLWFEKIHKLNLYNEQMNEIYLVLKQYNIKLLNDIEREEEFLNFIMSNNHVPAVNESYFTDNIDMHTWYINYKSKNRRFETIVHNSLSEYKELDLANIWPLIKQEFINILKILKRVPEHGEAILQNDIDVRVVYDKLESYDPIFFEKILLHLQTYNKKGLTVDDRIKELKEIVTSLGYIPYLQESRFSDGTDMFTWYKKYITILPNLEQDINSLVYKEPTMEKVNIYLIPNFKKTGGKFYTILTNVGDRLDLSSIESYEEALKIDSSIKKQGGLILKKGQTIDSVSYKKGK